MFERLKTTTKGLVYGGENISSNVDKFMRDHGDEPLLVIIISRNVVSSLLGRSKRDVKNKNKNGVFVFFLGSSFQ